MTKNSDLERLREETEAKQRAVLWPDMLRSGRSVDEFLWRGNPKATLLQRTAMAVIAIWFTGATIGLATALVKETSWTIRLMFFPPFLIGLLASVRLIRNVFLHAGRRGS